MGQSDTASARLREHVAPVLEGDDWECVDESPDRLRVEGSDRTLVVDRHDGPGRESRWSLTLRADGTTVGKFGRFESLDEVRAQVSALQGTDVRYTVCCDGERS
ncbi:hypothetical protein [Salinigranum halophilum]|uniref:hypothetical protein n=1 Tax=Salinigranum halophilum TaxID=2565931 RepID=UPI00115D87F4|nr:hypothetical protein [Salinigranum halophilum]